MLHKDFFYKFNNFLLVLVIFFVGGVIYSQSQVVHSQTPNNSSVVANGINFTSIPSYVINKDFKVGIEPGNFTAHFVSDGYTGELNDDAKAKFLNNGLELIDIPIDFEFVSDKSNVLLPGELYFPYLPKNTAPLNYRCVEKGQATDNVINDKNCLFGVTILSAFTDSTTTNIVVGNQEYKVEPASQDVFTSFTNILKDALQKLGNSIVKNVGTPDQSRQSVGTLRFWGDDDFQQFVPISAGNQSKKAILTSKGSVETLGNNIDEGLFPTEFSPGINVDISKRYKQANVLSTALCPRGSRGLPICPQGQITEPFTSNNSEQKIGKMSSNTNSIRITLAEIADAFMQVITRNNQKFEQKQERLASQISIRPIQETTTYSVKYNLCDAFESDRVKFNFKEFRNIYVDSNGQCAPRFLPGTSTENPSYNPNCEKYERVNPKIKRCITGVSKYVSENAALNCVKQVVENGTGCDEFSVEEGNLNLSFMESTFPLGLGAYFQNSTLQALDPGSSRGPYINYLSPGLCGKLNLGFKLKGSKPYIYNVGSQNGQSGAINRTNKFVSADIVNQYCIVGAYFSVFSYSFYQTAINSYSTTSPAGILNIPKTDLTCDKKETLFFGAKPVKTNIDYPDAKPIYIVDDNGRNANLTRDEVTIYHGYEAYPLTEILKDPALAGKRLSSYADLDMQVVISPVTNKPKYVVLSAVDEKGGNKAEMGMYLCKLPLHQEQYGVKIENNLCILIQKGKFIYPSHSFISLNQVFLKSGSVHNIDTITVIYKKTPPAGASNDGGDPPYVYRYIDVLDEYNLAKSIVSDEFIFSTNFKTSVDAVQLPGGQIAVSGLEKRTKGLLDFVSVSLLNPVDKSVFEINPQGNSVIGVKRSGSEVVLNENLCDGNSYCSVLTSLGYIFRSKIAYDNRSGILYTGMISNGFGVLFGVNLSNPVDKVTPVVFGYKPNSTTYTDNYDEISVMKISSSGEVQMFLKRSGYFLNVLPINLVSSDIKNTIQERCGNNCWPVIQKEFNPANFTTDCSDYEGKGQCGFAKMNKLGPPIVHSFQYEINGRIRAWYTHSGLDKTLLHSPDILYSFSGLYSKVEGDNSDEFSNVYIPVPGRVSLNKGNNLNTIDGPVPSPIRFFNFSNGGLKVGSELENANGMVRIRMTASYDYLPGYDRNVIIEKLDCISRLFNNVNDTNAYLSNNNLSGVSQNPFSQVSTPINQSPINQSQTSNAYTSVNPGEYCEETWCIPDEVEFGNGSTFRNDTNDTALKSRIVNFLSSRRPNLSSQYPAAVDKLCAAGSKYGVSCAVLVAIWIQESGGAINDNYAFGCFNNKPKFEDQVECAALTIYNRYNEYKSGIKLNGPTDVDPNGKTSSKFKGPYLTTPERGGGSCIPGTRFSYVFQKYTPIDRRINNDNQCNRGLVKRIGNDQELYCKDDAPRRTCAANDVPDPDNKNCIKATDETGKVVNPTVWGNAIETRPNMQSVLRQIGDPRINPDYNQCYPANTNIVGENTNSSNSNNIQKILEQYDTSITSLIGKMTINLRNWGKDDSAGNIYMLLNVNMKDAYKDWIQSKYGKGATFDINKYFDGKGIQGAYIVPPGAEWSYNDEIGNVSGDFVESQVVPVMASTKAPWNNGNFDFDPSNRCRSNGRINTGCGWCEMATTIRLAAERAVGQDGRKLAQAPFTGQSAVGSNTSYGTGGGWKGDINHWSHSGVSVGTYNSLVPNGETGLDDKSKYVSIVTSTSNSSGLNDGDLILKNPYPLDSGVDMIITIQLQTTGSNSGYVTVQVLFGRKKVL